MKTNERLSSIRIKLYHIRRPNSKLSACFNPNYPCGTTQKLFSHPNLVYLSWSMCTWLQDYFKRLLSVSGGTDSEPTIYGLLDTHNCKIKKITVVQMDLFKQPTITSSLGSMRMCLCWQGITRLNVLVECLQSCGLSYLVKQAWNKHEKLFCRVS